ncbi:MAG: hypothetical protein ACE5ES_01830 [Candidatus Nanoarchaeia archaeon]
MKSLKIYNSDRIFIAGKSGSGKSYLAKEIFKALNRLVLVDYKHEVIIGGFGIIKSYSEFLDLVQKGHTKIIMRPSGTHEQINSELSKIETYIFNKGNWTIAFDELTKREKNFMDLPPSLDNIVRMGRSRGVGIIVIHQRPSRLELGFMSEAEHFFIFTLNLRVDKDKMRGVIGDENIGLIDKLDWDKHEFVYYSVREGKATISNI